MSSSRMKITTRVLLVSLGPFVLLAAVLVYGWYTSAANSLIDRAKQADDYFFLALQGHIRVELEEGRPIKQAARQSIRGHARGVKHLRLLELTTPDGRIVASLPPQPGRRFSFEREEIAKAARRAGPLEQFLVLRGNDLTKAVPVGPNLSPLIMEPTVHEFVAPVRDASGKTVLIIHLYLSTTSIPLQLRQILVFAVGFVGVVAATAVTLLVWVGRRYIERPLGELTRTAEAITEGNIYIRAPAQGKDEIGRLGRAFNKMTETLLHLEVRADTDGLTGMYNFRHFQRFLQRQIELGSQYGRVFSLAILDLDHFKEINDIYGHPEGDKVLSATGDYLRRSVRAADYVARYGGEEFVIIFPETTSAEAFEICDRLREELPKQVTTSDGARLVEISAGLADFPTVAQSAEKLLQAADTALLFAKKSGRNQVVHFLSLPERPLGPGPDVEAVVAQLRQAQLRSIADVVDHVEMVEYAKPGHGERVADSARWLAETAGLPAAQAEALYDAGRVHDVGKIGIPASILAKKGPLTESEIKAVRGHPAVGERVLLAMAQVSELIPAVLYHHERWDGTGYPRGLSGEKIPLSARILAIAEAYEAMMSDRPYRKAMSVEQALVELRRNAGTQFDPALVDAFIRGKAPEMSASA